eukprot:325676_1
MATQLKRIASIVRKTFQGIRIYKSTHARLSRFVPRASVQPIRQRSSVVYGGLMTIAFGTSSGYILSKHRNALCAASVHPHDSKSFNLLNKVRTLAPSVDANKMLRQLQQVYIKNEEVTQDFVIELFQQCGVSDARIARELFRILDWNADGKIKPEEIACCFTLFQTGTKVDRYRFLFSCIDLNNSKAVKKEEFRTFCATMLEMKYRLTGIKGDREPYEWYFEIYESDYRSIARLRANMMVQKIFLWADQHRHGELNMSEFLHWCKRGGRAVDILESTLSDVCQEGLGTRPPR